MSSPNHLRTLFKWFTIIAVIGGIAAVLVRHGQWLLYASIMMVLFITQPSREDQFGPGPDPIAGTIVEEAFAGGMGTTWNAWEQEYTVNQPINDVRIYYQNEMNTYCQTAYSWTEADNMQTAHCYTDPCDPLEESHEFYAGKGPFIRFVVELSPVDEHTTAVYQSHFSAFHDCSHFLD